MRKALSVILASTMAFSLGAGAPMSALASTEATDGPRPKIGMIWYGNTDAMGGTFYAWANHAAEVVGVDLEWALGSYTTADELADCENLVSSGCDGIYFIPMDTAANLQLGNYCQESQVYWAISNRAILDDGVKAACDANPYFVAHVQDDNYEVAKEMTKVLADQGVTKVGLISGDPTDAMMVDRNKGFQDGCEENGITIQGSFQLDSSNTSVTVDGVNNFLTLYPDMEGLLCVAGTAGTGEAIISTLNGSGKDKGSIKLATFDTFEGNMEAFNDGWLAAACGGYTSECLAAFLALANKLKGNSLSDSVVELSLSPIMITSADDMEIFSKYVDNKDVQLYSDDYLQKLVSPDATIEDYEKMMSDWSIDFVKEAAEQ